MSEDAGGSAGGNGGDDGGWGSDGDDQDVPEQVTGQHDSYIINLMPFAMDDTLTDEQFGYFQDLYYQGFVSSHNQGARELFISYLDDRYDLDFDWNAWREEYESV